MLSQSKRSVSGRLKSGVSKTEIFLVAYVMRISFKIEKNALLKGKLGKKTRYNMYYKAEE